MNKFINSLTKKNTTTENGAISNSSTGNELLNQFAKAGTYRGRDENSINQDMLSIWDNKELAMRFLFYLRMVTRKVKGFKNTETQQKGQGVRDEFYKRMAWVAKHDYETFKNNLWLVPEVGTWKDLLKLLQFGGNFVKMSDILDVFALGMGNDNHVANIKKYLPTIRKELKTDWKKTCAKFRKAFQMRFKMSDVQYRAYKSSGESHEFQRVICRREYAKLNFNKIAGKALTMLAVRTGKDSKTFIERHGLEAKYQKWLSKQPVAKFKGYPYEILTAAYGGSSMGAYRSVSPRGAKRMTADKQFANLVKEAHADGRGIKGNVWCALDTSGSMTSEVVKGVTAYDICISLGIYFSSLNEGAFRDNVIMFDNRSTVMQLKGNFCDKVDKIKAANTAWGGTNFQSVIDEIVRIRKSNPQIPIEDYPETLLVVSDMQFNPTGNMDTNYELAMKKLRAVGLNDITIVWWYVTGRGKDFPSTIDDKGTILIGGFDGAIMTLLLGGDEIVDSKTGVKRKPTPLEAMLIALDQEILQYIQE